MNKTLQSLEANQNKNNYLVSNFYKKLKEGRNLVHKGFFGGGKWKKDWISKWRTFFTKIVSQYTIKMQSKAILKATFK